MLMSLRQFNLFCLACVHCRRTRNVDCILSGVQKSILFRVKILVMWKSILFRKKIFRSYSSKKHFVSQAKNIYGTGSVDRKKAPWEKMIVNLFLIFNCSLVFKCSEILIQFTKLT